MIISSLKAHPLLYTVAALAIVGVGYATLQPNASDDTYDTMVVDLSDLVQEVEVTGKVRPLQERDLAFQRSGIVALVSKEVGDTVKVGEEIVRLDTSELSAQLQQANATIEQAENTLIELRRGSRPEELALKKTAVENAERTLEDARDSLDFTQQKAETDLASVYDAAVSTAQSGVITAKNALVIMSTLQDDRFVGSGVSTEDFSGPKGTAIFELFGISNAEQWNAAAISELQGGVYMQTRMLTSQDSYDTQKEVLEEALGALRATSDALGAMPVLSTFSSTEKTNLSTQRSAVASAITSLASSLQSIEVQRAANTSAISTARAAVTTAENGLRQAENELSLLQAGSTEEAIATQESRVRSAYAQRDFILSQIRAMIINAPISGTITMQKAKTGSFAQAGNTIVSINSLNGFEIETFVPEVDIAKVSVGDPVNVTLDAYDDSDVFEATVSMIDPAETVIEGVSTYKVTVVFIDPEDARIKSGMTADATIITETKEAVIAVPTRAVVREDGSSYVRKREGEGYELVEVSLGLRGSSGSTEITEGLTEGDEIVTFVRE